MDSDHDLVKRLRNESPEQFISLVKMHLSFCLDQCTDEVDCLTPLQNKGNSEKRSVLSSHRKHKLTKVPSQDGGIKYSLQIFQLIDYLSQPSSLEQEGIFRRSGKVKQQQELMNLVKTKSSDEITQLLQSNLYSVHEVATVLKNLLADMSEPLLVESYYPFHCNLAKINHQQRQIRGLQMLIQLLPKENAEMLRRVLDLLHQVTLNSDLNKMNALNLGTMMAPHILCPRKMSAEDLTTSASSLAQIVSFMIENAKVVFDYPAEFINDVRLHFKRDGEEDASSTASTPPVKTNMTFVDREMTAKLVADGDPTEAALAELYAYVQSQPESEVKKKWVHKFNKENGCGTPKVIMNSSISEICSKNGKNLSQSIRKHLFNGAAITPKRRHSKSTYRSHGLCYSSETSPDSLDCVPFDSLKSPVSKIFASHSSPRSVFVESTPRTSDFIRHPAYSRHTSRPEMSSPAAAGAGSPGDSKENGRDPHPVISPLTQSARRLPFYVRDTIMTPRCRKPVFTFSPIDEPSDDLVPNMDPIQLPGSDVAYAQRQQQQQVEAVKESADLLEDLGVEFLVEHKSPESISSDIGSGSDSGSSAGSDIGGNSSSSSGSGTGSSIRSNSTSSGDAEEERSSSDDNESSLTSPFKHYLTSRDIQVCDLQDCSDAVDDSLLDSVQPVSDSLLEFLDGNEPSSQLVSPTRPTPPPLTKSILFETSL